MSLPPGFLEELRSRTSLTQVVGRKVMWDMRKSNQGKGDMWAPCPFHQEKTASFHVDDRKGFYYCFGCHAKGDAISFVRETENVEFMEAVEILAREAGMTLPARDPQAAQKADRRSELAEITEAAVRFFRLSLNQQAASGARDYLARRGLEAAAQERFELGYAPEGNALFAHLTGRGVDPQKIIDAGLAARPDDGRAPYDRFRGRIIFPIRDPRGRCISFGGRSMDPNARAKYLNGPETELFDKGRSLYWHGPAREAAGKGQTLIVAEGYMDVIALVQAGFGATVAPLGTAVTEDQLRLLWRIADEPVIALDGDKAGLRAAYRVIDIALPLLEAGKSLRFALMPEGQDPDDLIRASGAGAMQNLVDGALPMVQLLWARETEGQVFDSPERRAALDRVLREKIKLISDPSIRSHYGQAIKEMRWQLFNPRRSNNGGRGQGRKWQPPGTPQASTKSSLLAAADSRVDDHIREAVILATLIATPSVIDEVEPQLERMECRDSDHDAIRAELLALPPGADARAAVGARIGDDALENLMRIPHVAICPAVRHPGDAEQARLTLDEAFGKLSALRGLVAEIAEAEEELSGVADEALTWRLREAAEARNRALRSQQEDKAAYDKGPNGLMMDRDERSAFDALLNKITYTKPRR
ncbi:DNA primase [Lutimaribacter sp. EGI FJ00015]|uniref:DNA primase n=1 Tax=Lutimaribacter degradans TaxID=2945989 RepID=A0ACC5ZSM1_9RHOB|nr:DNA primase [Lutimaribacter sp. EGI FJ00013]MCM2560781.1 DNA primase [Lutimaribacter sp. EGI FJ00013]MCO0612273.1 DNA primase [Lutimaribacter sp. EGI FJ00015]MCO0634606.1 DNA primase [Lutimaribacter sp. EGI FJ00014]